MSINDSIATFATGSHTRLRTDVGLFTLGRYAPGPTTAATIAASVQPVSGRQLKAVGEGRRADETRVVYTTSELRTQTPDTDADRILIDGEPWEVFKVETWIFIGVTHYRAYVSRMKVGGMISGVGAVMDGDTSSGAGTVA